MSRNKWLGAGFSAALLMTAASGLAIAQTTSDDSSANMTQDQAAPSATSTGAMSAPAAGVDTTGVRMSADQMPPDQAKALAAGDNRLVTNGPVPDTPENRAKYTPLSHAGKRSQPAGN